MKNLNTHLHRMKSLIESKHGIIKPLISEQGEKENTLNDVLPDGGNEFKENCEDVIDMLEELIESLEKCCSSTDPLETFKKDFTCIDNMKEVSEKFEDMMSMANNPIGL